MTVSMPVETRHIGFVESEGLIDESAQSSALAGTTDGMKDGGLRPGDLFAGRYRLVRLIGQGGMGVVWEAQNDALDIRVAIKLIHKSTATPDEQQRLIFEAKAAARLVDPGVVRVFDCGQTPNGEPYIVMEYLQGEDLATRLDHRGRLQPIEAVRTLLPILRALGTAHAAAIVHRDVKPENVFLTRSATCEEQPKLLDFGIAKVELPWEKRLTQAGSALGSPNYMSPEQARGEEVDPRADIWGFCVVLYEVIAGCLPFDGNGYNAVMYSILSTTPDSFMHLGVEEPELWEIVARGLARERNTRWQSCAELHRALSAWLIARGVMHDVSGVSLHAGMQHRTSHVRTLESVRPAAVSLTNERGGSAARGLFTGDRAEPGGTLWKLRPRWFLPVVSLLFLVGASLTTWRVWLNSQIVPLRPVHPAVGMSPPVPLPAQEQPTGARTMMQAQPQPFQAQQVQPPQAASARTPGTSLSSATATQPGSASGTAVAAPRKPQGSGVTKPAGAAEKARATKGDSFKSPFE